MQVTITYYKKLLIYLNDWLYKLNQQIFKDFKENEIQKKYIFEYPMYSDIFSLGKNKQYSLILYNYKLLKNKKLKNLKEIKQIKYDCEKNIELLTYDIIAMLNVYKHFIENQVNTNSKTFNNKFYIYNNYLNKNHIWLHNYFNTIDL